MPAARNAWKSCFASSYAAFSITSANGAGTASISALNGLVANLISLPAPLAQSRIFPISSGGSPAWAMFCHWVPTFPLRIPYSANFPMRWSGVPVMPCWAIETPKRSWMAR